MGNKHMLKIVNHYPRQKKQDLNQAFQIPRKELESSSSGALSLLISNKNPESIESMPSNEVLDRIESNISSWIPSYENSSILDEHKASLNIPVFNDFKIEEKKRIMRPETLKKKLNSDIEKCHFLQNLSCQMKVKDSCCYTQEDTKELDLTVLETARFGRSKEKDQKPKFMSKPNKPICTKKPPSKQLLYKLRPKVSAYKPAAKK